MVILAIELSMFNSMCCFFDTAKTDKDDALKLAMMGQLLAVHVPDRRLVNIAP